MIDHSTGDGIRTTAGRLKKVLCSLAILIS